MGLNQTLKKTLYLYWYWKILHIITEAEIFNLTCLMFDCQLHLYLNTINTHMIIPESFHFEAEGYAQLCETDACLCIWMLEISGSDAANIYARC